MSEFLDLETPYRSIRVAELKMFHAKAVARWRGLVVAAQEKMGGVNSGIGFIGSPGWVITGSLVLGAIENALSSASSKAGIKMLGEAGALMAEIQERGVFIPISQVSNLETGRPDAWQAVVDNVSFITLGDEFLRVRTSDAAEISVRWSAVNSLGFSRD